MKTFFALFAILSVVLGAFNPDGEFFSQKVCFDGTAISFCENAVRQDSGIAFVESDIFFDDVNDEFLVAFVEHEVGGGVALHDSLFFQKFNAAGVAITNRIPVLPFVQDQEAKIRPRMGFDRTRNRVLIAFEYIFFDEPNPEIPTTRISLLEISTGNVLVSNRQLSPFSSLTTPSTHLTVLFNEGQDEYAITYFGTGAVQGQSHAVFHRIDPNGADLGSTIFAREGFSTERPFIAIGASSYFIGAEVINGDNSDVFVISSPFAGNFNFNLSVAVTNTPERETDINLKAFGNQVVAAFTSVGDASTSLELRLLDATTLAVENSKSVNDFGRYDQVVLAVGTTEIATIYRANRNSIHLSIFDANFITLDTERIDAPNNAANYEPTSPFVAINPTTKDHFVLWSTSFIAAPPPPPPVSATTGEEPNSANAFFASFFLVATMLIVILF